jgi:hypothetical protein
VFRVDAGGGILRPAAAQDDKAKEAEKLFKAMESKVRNAKTLQCEFESTFNEIEAKGTLTLGAEDKFRADFVFKNGKKIENALFVCDGIKLLERDKGPRDLTEIEMGRVGLHFHKRITRLGIHMSCLTLENPGAASLDELAVSE